MTPTPRPSLEEFEVGDLDVTDLEILQRTAALYDALDPVPVGLVDRIQFGITLDALHAEIAELQRSSGLVGVRSEGATDAQTVTFTSPSLTTMITVTPGSAETARVDGWIAPGGGVFVELRTASGMLSTTADDDGRFAFEDVPRGVVQFVLRPDPSTGQPPVVTPSVEL
jgi:hypothetical protein